VLTSEKTATKTGDFEVQVVDGPMLHSKKNGDGLVSNEEKFERICETINKLLPGKAATAPAEEEVPSKKAPAKKGRNASTSRKGKEVANDAVEKEEAPPAKRRGRKPSASTTVNKEEEDDDDKKKSTRSTSTSRKTTAAAATKKRAASASAPKRGRSASSKRARK